MNIKAKETANYRFKALVNPVIIGLQYSKVHPDKVVSVEIEDDNGKYWNVGIDSFYRHFTIVPVGEA